MFIKKLKSKLLLLSFSSIIFLSACSHHPPIINYHNCVKTHDIISINNISYFTWSKNEDKMYFLHTNSNSTSNVESDLYSFDFNTKTLTNKYKAFLTKPFTEKESTDDSIIYRVPDNSLKIYVEDEDKLKYYSEKLGLSELKIDDSNKPQDISDFKNTFIKYPIIPVSFDLKYKLSLPYNYFNTIKLTNLESKKEVNIHMSNLSNLSITDYHLQFFPNSTNFVFISNSISDYFYAALDLKSGKLSAFNYFSRGKSLTNILGINSKYVFYIYENHLYKSDLKENKEEDLLTLETQKIKNSSNFSISESGKYLAYEAFEINEKESFGNNGKRVIIIKNLETLEDVKSISFDELKKVEPSIHLTGIAC